jgi:hypothetical protein
MNWNRIRHGSRERRGRRRPKMPTTVDDLFIVWRLNLNPSWARGLTARMVTGTGSPR